MQSGLLERIETIYFLIKMASDCTSNFESDIQVNPCKNCPGSPPKRYFDDSDRQNAA